MIRTAISPRLAIKTLRNNCETRPDQLCTKRGKRNLVSLELRNMGGAICRSATASDIPAITAIYAHHVRCGTATFEIEPPSCHEMDRRLREIQEQSLPYLVAESDGSVIGYAYAGRYRARSAYRFTLEDSVYVHPDFTSRGYGQLLLGRLIDICSAKHSRQMIAIIGDRSNIPSIRLHAKFEFREAGVLERVGRKFGRWIDTLMMQRTLYRDERLQQIRQILGHEASAIVALQKVADSLRQNGRYGWVGLYKVDHNAGEVRNLVFSGPGPPAHPVFPVQNGITGIVIRERRTVNVGDVSANPLYLTTFGSTRSEIIVPVYATTTGALVGTIDVESEDLNTFSEEDEIFLEDCAQAIAALWGRM